MINYEKFLQNNRWVIEKIGWALRKLALLKVQIQTSIDLFGLDLDKMGLPWGLVFYHSSPFKEISVLLLPEH